MKRNCCILNNDNNNNKTKNKTKTSKQKVMQNASVLTLKCTPIFLENLNSSIAITAAKFYD